MEQNQQQRPVDSQEEYKEETTPMSRTQGIHRAPLEPNQRPEGSRRKKGAIAAVVILIAVILAVLFFWLFDVDANVQGDLDVPNVNTDIEAPDVDAQGGNAPDVDVQGGELPEVDVNPADEPDEAGEPAPSG